MVPRSLRRTHKLTACMYPFMFAAAAGDTNELDLVDYLVRHITQLLLSRDNERDDNYIVPVPYLQ
jgi:hypothetical protein